MSVLWSIPINSCLGDYQPCERLGWRYPTRGSGLRHPTRISTFHESLQAHYTPRSPRTHPVSSENSPAGTEPGAGDGAHTRRWRRSAPRQRGRLLYPLPRSSITCNPATAGGTHGTASNTSSHPAVERARNADAGAYCVCVLSTETTYPLGQYSRIRQEPTVLNCIDQISKLGTGGWDIPASGPISGPISPLTPAS